MEQWSDPDPGSGISKQNLLIACVKKEAGSGIRCFFTPRIRDPDPGWSNGRIRIRDGAMVGSGSGMEQWSDPDPGSGIKHPGSATLHCHYPVLNRSIKK
jgi:hypothetical protein